MLQGCSIGDRQSAFGAFAETLRILITDVNDNAPLFLPISETFGEQPGLVHPLSFFALTRALPRSLAVRTFLQPGRGCGSAGARLGLLDAFHEGCGVKSSSGGGMSRAALSPGAVRAWGLQQAHQRDHAVCLSPAVVVPEVSPVGLQVATVKVRNCVCASVSLQSQAHLSLPWAGGGHSHPCSCHALSPQATDADSGLAGTITFSVASVVLVEDNGASQLLDSLFNVDAMKEGDTYVGTIR